MVEFSSRKTPSITVMDNRDLNIRQIEYCRHPDTPELTDERVTYQQVDSHGFLVSMTDPRLYKKGLFNFYFVSDLAGLALLTTGVDNGYSLIINDIEGHILLSIDANDVQHTYEYEGVQSLGRLIRVWEKTADSKVRTTECFEYAAKTPSFQNANLCGQCIRHYDTAGLLQLNQVSILGHSISQTRRLIKYADDIEFDIDWQNSERDKQLALTPYVNQLTTDATGANLVSIDAKGHQQRVVYDIAGQIKIGWLKVNNEREMKVLDDIVYLPTGQKSRETFGNGVISHYEYEVQTQRLIRVKTERPTEHTLGFKLIQDLHYQYDPVGNLLSLYNFAEPTRFWRNQKIEAKQVFHYDTLYQLVSASGREMANQHPKNTLNSMFTTFDSATYTRYVRTYHYDESGNLTHIHHRAPATNQCYSTNITVSHHSNHGVLDPLVKNVEQVERFFTPAGGQKLLLQGQTLDWTAYQELRSVRSSKVNEHYRYDSQRQRILKVTESAEQKSSVTYLANLELRCHPRQGKLQVISLDELVGIALQVFHRDETEPKEINNNAMRYTLTSLIGSRGTELDGNGSIVSQEEYYPFGGTASWLADSEVTAGYKTRHYGGKERDITGLYYYGSRYYQPWIGRWLSADPMGAIDGNNLYRMVRNNPMTYHDEQGQYPKIAHYIWLGNKDIPTEGISNIAIFKNQNPQYKINLWSDNPNRLKNSLIERGYSQAIFNVIHVRKPAPFDYQYQAAINRESTNTAYANYAAASDMLRIGILKRFGGLYMDIDVMVDGPIGNIRPLLDNQDELPDLLIHQGRDYRGKTVLGNAVVVANRNAFSLHSLMRYIRHIYSQNNVEPFISIDPQSKFDTLTAKKNYYYPSFSWKYLMWQGKRSIPHIRRNITVDGTGPGMFVSWIRSSSPFDKRLRARKLIYQSGFFGHRTPLMSWAYGLNADGRTWYKTPKIRRASI
ncbi:RHS repeat-associated core domain-containing protein [Providencia rettgeri]|uniref:RHS repeat-associated core domain-containing protein n=1 Tax=Providencia rettgeri TaxID=587 RepID=UPI00235F9170|nr:RHS repeat-associated core domain-containing protein [Providencia rettgeri]